MGLTTISKIIVILETPFLEEVLAECKNRGVRGYTCEPCFGHGRHDVFADPMTDYNQMRVEMLTSRPVAEAVLEYLSSPSFRNRPMIAYVEDVEVADPRRFT